MALSSRYTQPLTQLALLIKEEDQATRKEAVFNVYDFVLKIFQKLNIPPPPPARRLSHETDQTSTLEPRRKRRRLSTDPARSSPVPESEAVDDRPASLPLASTSSLIYTAAKPSPQWVARVQISAEQCCEDLTATAGRFADELLRLEFKERRNNQLVHTRLKAEDVRVLVNFLFSDVFGDGCRERIFALIDELKTTPEEAEPLTSGVLAASRAADPKLLPEVRAFFSTYSTWHQGEIEHSKVYPMILQSIRSYQLYVAFAQLRTIATGPRGNEFRDFLANEGFYQSRGVDIRTCILRYLCRELNMSTGQLNNTLQAQLGIYYFVQEFGPGVLVLLPKVASYRITRFGTQKIQDILHRLRAALPNAVALCALAEANILNPILDGEPLPLLLPARTPSRLTLSLIESVTAITPGNVTASTPPATSSIEDGLPSKTSPLIDALSPSTTTHKGGGLEKRQSRKRRR